MHDSATAAVAQPDRLGVADTGGESPLIGIDYSFRATGPALSH
jgi:hypothetical protein